MTRKKKFTHFVFRLFLAILPLNFITGQPALLQVEALPIGAQVN